MNIFNAIEFVCIAWSLMTDSEGRLKPSFFQLSHVIQDNMGGTSGAIYSLMLTAASQAVQKLAPKMNGKSYDAINLWSDVLQYSIETVSRYSSAKPGDRTMLGMCSLVCLLFAQLFINAIAFRSTEQCFGDISEQRSQSSSPFDCPLSRVECDQRRRY